MKVQSFLTAVFSFNRGLLLQNCVRSIRRFYPESDLVIFDDDSGDLETLRVLDQLERSGCRIVYSDHPANQISGDLYRNMNRALRIAAAEGREFVHFMQDDTQFVRRRPDLAEHVAEIFARRPLAYQVQAHFLKRLGRSETTPLRDVRAYRFAGLGGDLGFFHTRRVLADGLRLGPRERVWAARAAARGLEACGTGDPVVARVPWPKNSRFRGTKGYEIRAEHELLLRPLDDATAARLTSRDLGQRPWGDDWYEPLGWRCWKPYRSDPSRAKWLAQIVASALRWRSLRGLIPRRVGDDSRLAHVASAA